MLSHEDALTLDKRFPFQIDAVTLSEEDNADAAFHWHSFMEITCVLEGAGCYYVSDRAYEVCEGDILVFNSAELHGWQVFQGRMRVLAMVFSEDIVSGFGSALDMEYLRPFIGRGSNFRNRIGHNEPCARQIAATMAEIDAEWRTRSEGYALMIRSDLLRVLTMLVRHYHGDARDSDAGDRGRALKRLQPAFDYIEDSFCGRVTLKQAAERVFMSPNYFSHFFHAATRISFSDYVTLRRIRKARAMMETSGKSIYEIAIECGFPNSSNFYRLYKKHTGESPRQGRQG